MTLFEHSLGFYFYFNSVSDEEKFAELFQKEKGLLVEKLGAKNLLISEKKILGESLDICLKDDEDVLEKPATI